MTEDISPEEKTQPNKVIRKILAESEKVDAEASRLKPVVGTPDQEPGQAPFLDDKELPSPDHTGDTVNNASWYGDPPVSSYPYQGPTTAIPAKGTPVETKQPLVSSPPENHTYIPPRVDEVDLGATSVSPNVFQNARTEQMRPVQWPTRPMTYSPPPPPIYPPSTGGRATRPKPAKKGSFSGCFLGVLIAFLFMGVFLVVAVGAFLVYQYFSIAAGLPSVDDLRNRATQFETTRIYDRSGSLIYEIIDPNAGRHTYVELDKISRYLLAATIATEDKEFLTHPGFDLLAIGRAMWQNYTSGHITSGASTITQQLARGLLLSPEEVNERTIRRKSREIVLAAELTRKYSKKEILELYLNENFYGNYAYGIEAGSETYFGTTADKLTLGQSAFLAGLPQAPSVYDVFTNRDQTLARQKQVLLLLLELSKESGGCIELGTGFEKVCITPQDVAEASKEIDEYNFRLSENQMKFPHWVNFIRTQLEALYDGQTIFRSGFRVYTTLDPEMQQKAQEIVRQQVDSLSEKMVTDGALVAIKPSTGEILAMVGSADFYNEAIAGQINMSVSPRQPGSSIKPLTYTAAFEKGWNPATVIWDVHSEFPPSGDPNDTRDPYIPVNYDGRFHGPVSARVALSNSYNVPAVKTLDFVGLYDNPETPKEDGFLAFTRRMGITTLTREDYGLSLTLGGGDVTLLELTGAYAIFANNGIRIPPVAITRIEDHTGKLVYEYKPPAGDQVIRPEHAYQITSILSDNNARSPMFGTNSVINLPFTVAAKTGTTNDFRDNWTLGYTPDLAVGVWVGNADYSPMVNTTGLTGAAPIWAEFMQYAISMIPDAPSAFVRPAGIVERTVCDASGTEPSASCPSQHTEIFAYDQLPPTKENDLWQKVKIDTWTGLKASPACGEFVEDKTVMNVTDKWAKKWLEDTDEGRGWVKTMGFSFPVVYPPKSECTKDDIHPVIAFANLTDGQTITANPQDLFVVVKADDLKRFSIQWGVGAKPKEWKTLVKDMNRPFPLAEKIYTWNMDMVPSGLVTLRITAYGERGFAKKQITINLNLPTPTPTNTPEPTTTPTVTNTLIPTYTSTATPTQEPSSTPTFAFPFPPILPSATP